jgi:hypothetical protein
MGQRRITPTKYAIRKSVLPQSLDEEYASKLRFAAQLIEQLRAAGLECEMSSEMPAQKM